MPARRRSACVNLGFSARRDRTASSAPRRPARTRPRSGRSRRRPPVAGGKSRARRRRHAAERHGALPRRGRAHRRELPGGAPRGPRVPRHERAQRYGRVDDRCRRRRARGRQDHRTPRAAAAGDRARARPPPLRNADARQHAGARDRRVRRERDAPAPTRPDAAVLDRDRRGSITRAPAGDPRREPVARRRAPRGRGHAVPAPGLESRTSAARPGRSSPPTAARRRRPRRR